MAWRSPEKSPCKSVLYKGFWCQSVLAERESANHDISLVFLMRLEAK